MPAGGSSGSSRKPQRENEGTVKMGEKGRTRTKAVWIELSSLCTYTPKMYMLFSMSLLSPPPLSVSLSAHKVDRVGSGGKVLHGSVRPSSSSGRKRARSAENGEESGSDGDTHAEDEGKGRGHSYRGEQEPPKRYVCLREREREERERERERERCLHVVPLNASCVGNVCVYNTYSILWEQLAGRHISFNFFREHLCDNLPWLADSDI